MAECHPVGFQWVMEAKAAAPRSFTSIRGSQDQRARGPARADPGQRDIAFLGGLINYVLREEKYFRDYVLAYTNAPVILTEDFADTEDLDGVFSGFDSEHRAYDFEAACQLSLQLSGGIALLLPPPG